MPYKHANGCNCMTMTEFLAAEGKREGKSGGEVWTDIIDDMAEDDKRMEKEYLSNPPWLLKELKKECDLYREDDDTFPVPVKIIQVKSAKSHQSFKTSKFETELVVQCKDKKTRIAKWWRQDWSGSFYEPPDSDGDISWEDLS